MPFNPSPKVAAARDIGKKFNKKIIVVLMIDDERLEYASYGQTKALCTTAKGIADVAYDAVMKRIKAGI
jgi:hypothetical protein